MERCDRGWVFCPEFAGDSPMEASPDEWDTRVFLFGPELLPDSDLQRGSPVLIPQAPAESEDVPVSTGSRRDEERSPERSEEPEIRVEETSGHQPGPKVSNEAG